MSWCFPGSSNSSFCFLFIQMKSESSANSSCDAPADLSQPAARRPPGWFWIASSLCFQNYSQPLARLHAELFGTGFGSPGWELWRSDLVVYVALMEVIYSQSHDLTVTPGPAGPFTEPAPPAGQQVSLIELLLSLSWLLMASRKSEIKVAENIFSLKSAVFKRKGF